MAISVEPTRTVDRREHPWQFCIGFDHDVQVAIGYCRWHWWRHDSLAAIAKWKHCWSSVAESMPCPSSPFVPSTPVTYRYTNTAWIHRSEELLRHIRISVIFTGYIRILKELRVDIRIEHVGVIIGQILGKQIGITRRCATCTTNVYEPDLSSKTIYLERRHSSVSVGLDCSCSHSLETNENSETFTPRRLLPRYGLRGREGSKPWVLLIGVWDNHGVPTTGAPPLSVGTSMYGPTPP